MSKNKQYEIIEIAGKFQKTVKDIITISGGSPYTKEKCKIKISPSRENTGITFITKNDIKIPALIAYTKDDNDVHTTSLKKGDEEIKTVEHLLSAVWGMGIDNAIIKMYTSHLPFLDASAKGYSEKIDRVGIETQKRLRKYVKIKTIIKFVENPEDERRAILIPSDKTIIRSTTSFNNIIGTKTVEFDCDEDEYLHKISFARTFLRSPLDDQGKVWDYVRKLFPFIPLDPKNSPIIVYDDEKFITILQTEDEPARHKVLDFIGDISLLGYRLLSEIELNLPGHRFTRQIAKEISSKLA